MTNEPYEIDAIRQVAAALEPMTDIERDRILTWAWSRFVDDPKAARLRDNLSTQLAEEAI